jgi:uncharacterized membrane protein
MKFIVLFATVASLAFLMLHVFTKRERKQVRKGFRQLLVPLLIAAVATAAAVFIGLSPTMKVI